MPIYTLTQNPSNIPNLTLWLDAADQSTLGLTQTGTFTASVSSIKNKVGSENLVANNQRPIYYYSGVNKKGSIYFNNLNPTTGGNLTLSHMTMSFSLTHSLYFVGTSGAGQTSTVGRYLLSIRRRGRTIYNYSDISICQFPLGTSSFFSYLESSPPYSQTNYNFGFNMGTYGVTNSNTIVFTNRSYGTFSVVKTELFQSNSNKQLLQQKFGGGGTYSQIVIGDFLNVNYGISPNDVNPARNSFFCEMLFYSRVLTDEENNRVTQYLKSKWLGQ